MEITLAVGYQRRRSVLGGAFEGHVVTVLLLLIGGIVVIGVTYALVRGVLGLL